jgi:hypothetical protein
MLIAGNKTDDSTSKNVFAVYATKLSTFVTLQD